MAALLLGACTAQPGDGHSQERPGTASPPPYSFTPPDSPFTRTNTMITASCEMGARYAAVAVRAWRPGTWKRLAERYFPVPSNAVFGYRPGAPKVHIPLLDLCSEDQSPYERSEMEYMTPRIRALFDEGFTRMAVVLFSPGSNATQAASVGFRDAQDKIDRLEATAGRDEQNAVMSPAAAAFGSRTQTVSADHGSVPGPQTTWGESRIGRSPTEVRQPDTTCRW